MPELRQEYLDILEKREWSVSGYTDDGRVELHARGPEIERLYLDSKILPGELRALVMVSNCLEREFIHRQLATGQPLHMNVL